MSGERARSAVTAEYRSVHPNVPGVPWWGAVLIAAIATAIGFAFDAGAGKELTGVFASLYAIGCILAVLAVRQAAIFTAVVQPPVLLFVSVPGAYFLFHGAKIGGLKDILINCGYPLVERFPLMLFTSAAVLVIGLLRWYLGTSARPVVTGTDDKPAAGLLSAIGTKISGLFPSSDHQQGPPKHRHAIDRQRKTTKPKPTRTSRPSKTAKKADPTRSRRQRRRHEIAEPPTERTRRRRSSSSRHADLPPETRRRRTSRDASRTTRDPYERREPYERRAPHDRRGRHEIYDPFEPYEPPQRRRPGSLGSNGTHHPISRVRYRGNAPTESREESTARPRARSYEADSWEYDI